MDFETNGTTTYNPQFGYQAYTNPFNGLVITQFNNQHQGEHCPPYETHYENKLILTPYEAIALHSVLNDYIEAFKRGDFPQLVDTTSGYSDAKENEG
jgi:hypothetical protein